MSERQENCLHLRRHHIVNFTYNGKWYSKEVCLNCNKQFDTFIRDVNQNSVDDCAAADASQGIA